MYVGADVYIYIHIYTHVCVSMCVRVRICATEDTWRIRARSVIKTRLRVLLSPFCHTVDGEIGLVAEGMLVNATSCKLHRLIRCWISS